MNRKLGALFALLTASLVGALALAGVSQATEPPLTADHGKSCGEVTFTFVNNTTHTYSADVRVDGEDGTDDEVTGLTIQNGPHAGKPFGQRYRVVDLPPGETVQHVVEFDEDSGTHQVVYRIWRGPENDYYVDWRGPVEVESDCEPEPTPSDTPSPTDDPSASPSDNPSASPSDTPSDTPSASPSTTPPVTVTTEPAGGLPRTGYPSWFRWVMAGGLALIASGAGLLLLARRRGWLYS